MFSQQNISHVVANWIDVLLDFSFTVTHLPGFLLVLPDALSRCFPPMILSKCSELSVASVQLDPLVVYPDRELREFVRERFDKSCPSPQERSNLLSQHHALGHFGGEALYRSLWKANIYWPFMRRDALQFVAGCSACLRQSVGLKGFAPLRPIVAKYPFDHASMDLAGPMPQTSPRGHNYILVFVDVCTRFCILLPLQSKSALCVARALWWIFCLMGFPLVLQSDRGSEFVNSVLSALAQLTGVDHHLAAAYNPQSNGLAEAFVKMAKNALFKMCGGNLKDFDLFLPSVQLAINAKDSALTSSTPFSLALGRPFNFPADSSAASSALLSEPELKSRFEAVHAVIYPEITEAVSAKQRSRARRVDSKRNLKLDPLPLGTSVMLEDPVRKSKSEPGWPVPGFFLFFF